MKMESSPVFPRRHNIAAKQGVRADTCLEEGKQRKASAVRGSSGHKRIPFRAAPPQSCRPGCWQGEANRGQITKASFALKHYQYFCFKVNISTLNNLQLEIMWKYSSVQRAYILISRIFIKPWAKGTTYIISNSSKYGWICLTFQVQCRDLWSGNNEIIILLYAPQSGLSFFKNV